MKKKASKTKRKAAHKRATKRSNRLKETSALKSKRRAEFDQKIDDYIHKQRLAVQKLIGSKEKKEL